nr:hypothetical protein [Bacteroidota bacterium]
MLCQFLALVPGIALLLYYMFSRPLIDQPYSSMDLNELLISIKTIQPAKAMDYGKEAIFTKWIFVSLVIITLAFFINQAGFYFNKKRNNAFFGRKNQMNVWLLISFVLLLCILFFPERMSGGSFISSRFLMMFFLFLIVGFAPVKLPLFIKVMIFVMINWVNVGMLKVYIEKNSEHSKVAEEVWNASKVIKHNKTIYPVTRTQNWLYPGISNYLGIDKPIVALKNYEASQDYFPLKWNWDRLPDLMLGNRVGNNGCFTWPTQQSNPPRQIDYIFLFNDYNSEINDTCFVKLYDDIEKYFSWEYSSADGRIKIYRNNNISRLVGEWNLTEGNGYIEKWQFDDDTLMKGVGLSINNGITRITEKLAIVNSNSKISYLATVPGQNDGSTIAFHLVVSTDNSIVFENPEHDFPQRITYWFINDTTLKVDVESIDSTDNNFTMHFVKAGGQ